jgi:hypothetical protein
VFVINTRFYRNKKKSILVFFRKISFKHALLSGVFFYPIKIRETNKTVALLLRINLPYLRSIFSKGYTTIMNLILGLPRRTVRVECCDVATLGIMGLLT